MDVGFIGLGHMGEPMAARILKAGHALTLCDIRRERGRALEADGALRVAGPREVAARAEVVLTSLPGPGEVEAVVRGDAGVFAGLRPGSGYIDLSTNAPQTMREIAALGAEREIAVLDAPISGGIFGARDGTLTVFAGGERSVFARFEPLLRCIGENIVHMGPSGSGCATKLVNNAMMFINYLGAIEGMALGAKAGLDPQRLATVIKPSTGHSMIMERTMGLYAKRETMDSAVELAVKDMQLAVDLGRQLDVPLELSPLVEDMIRRYCADGRRGQEDIIELIGDFMRRSDVRG